MIVEKLLGFFKTNILKRNVILTSVRKFSSAVENVHLNDEVKSKTVQHGTPFLKNTFAGLFDKSVLVFPESLSKVDLKKLETKMAPIKEFSKQNGDLFNKESMEKLNALGLLSMQAGYHSCSETEMLRIFEDLSPNLCHFLHNHNLLGLRCVEKYASEEIKNSILTHLQHSSIAFCFHEKHTGDDLSQTNTMADLSSEGTTYRLNGRKTWVTMAPDVTDWLVVLAKVRNSELSPVNESGDAAMTAFLVDKSAINNNISLQGSSRENACGSAFAAYNIELSDVQVPATHVLGHVGGGFKLAVELLYGSFYFRTSNQAAMLKNAIGDVSKFCLENKQFNKVLNELPMIQNKVGKMAVSAYVMESMAYMTAGLVDGRDGEGGQAIDNIFVESACVQLFSSEHLRASLEDAMDVLGGVGYYGDNPLAKLLISLPRYSTVSNDMLRRYIALNCLQYAGVVMQDSLRKYRNPLNHLSHLVREGWKMSLMNKKQPPLVHRLHYSVHPDLSVCAESLETRVLLLKDLVCKYWTIFHNKLQEEELALMRFADIGVNIYAITCCLARATRSKSIGLMNADYEIMTCQAVIESLIKKIDDDMLKLELGDHSNGDIYRLKVAREAFKKKDYPLQHPTTRNW